MALLLKRVLTGFCLSVLILAWTPWPTQAVSLDDALALARETLPSYKAAAIRVQSTGELYKATLGPYFPSIDGSAVWRRHFTSSSLLGHVEFNDDSYNLIASLTLFDGGKRRANRNIGELNLVNDKETLKTNLLDLEFSVKTAFYNVLAQKEALGERKLQLQDSEKDYEVSEGRYKFGVARLSDVLQASVRLEQARFNVIQSEGNLNKALSDLNSLLGKPLDERYDIEGSLDFEMVLPPRALFLSVVLGRPEIKQAENAVKISENNRKLALSTFFPVLSAAASYEKSTGGLGALATGGVAVPEDKILALTATWNIFELGKFFQYRSSVLEKGVSQELLNDTKRKVMLDVDKAYEDVVTASNQLKVAQQQLKQAEQNYAQAFGEYKVGKGDILSLVQAESLLASAREQLVNSRLNLMVSKAQLERTAGIERVESLSQRVAPTQ